MAERKISTGIDRSLVKERLGNDILGFDPGMRLESGAQITLETKTEDPRTWKSVPKRVRNAIQAGIGTLFIDTVGNTAFQLTHEIPEAVRSSARRQIIDITPSLTTGVVLPIRETAANAAD